MMDLPLVLIGMTFTGLIYVAFPLLLVIGIIAMISSESKSRV